MKLYLVKIKPMAVIGIEADDDVTTADIAAFTAPLVALGFMPAAEAEAEDMRRAIPSSMKVAYRVVDGELVEVPA